MIDVSQLDDFARKCEAMKADLKPYAAKTMDEIGEEFLDIVQEEIMAADNVDIGVLLASFFKGVPGNVYQLDAGGLTLTIGTNVRYAKWVNKGHPQRPGRFIPGVWEGKHFRYIPGAKTGMVLRARFVKGSFFFDKAVKVLDQIFPERVDDAFERFFRRYFP